ncbi:hypothetical protein BpHYR1_022126 [Brachionus plicatilis]|uniref:Uncharacterized protein n=1 Tax=Brachionus plicatilis TaxID=10195 RepID=A0A3M7SFB3_BRAPC|nr:hypothetical protein BpHYR1_022126 [Brachionus plicatilis]
MPGNVFVKKSGKLNSDRHFGSIGYSGKLSFLTLLTNCRSALYEGNIATTSFDIIRSELTLVIICLEATFDTTFKQTKNKKKEAEIKKIIDVIYVKFGKHFNELNKV